MADPARLDPHQHLATTGRAELPFHQLEALAGAGDLHRARRVAHADHYCDLPLEAHLGQIDRQLEKRRGV
jgi:hypothetical protein